MHDDPYEPLPPGHRTINNSQRIYLVYSWGVLIDLAVINLCDEYWELVNIPSFTISLLVAIVLQAGLALCIHAEHKTAAYFLAMGGTRGKVLRGITTYLIIAGGKFVIMGVIILLFGARVEFLGPFHGTVSFVVVVFAVLIAEWIGKKIFFLLDQSPPD